MTATTVVATVIGDVLGSRGAEDRPALHEALAAALAEVNDETDPVAPLRITVGDEYQGAFADVGSALRAAFRLRLRLQESADVAVRHGVGWGPVEVLSEEPRVEDGPGWWSARTAIETVHDAEERPASRALRTAYHRADGCRGPDPAAVNAALVARDQLVAGLGPESVSVVGGMLAGMSQRHLAEQLGVSASAVSQRIRRDGLAAVVRVDELLAGLDDPEGEA
ncbi:SatD family protein [Nocardioides panacisoli]|uniref:SatD family protein n=1 Tax=Nocardioides panacisoli TaxID=627624 RepID=UPI001C630F3F|nr:SatD family protein [Nocardioides panacisoli]QYJ05355.1 SatD family protein [Nocardioides panacisoli]